jgi:2'-5' RNA ligase
MPKKGQLPHCSIGAKISVELYDRMTELAHRFEYRSLTEFIVDALRLYCSLLEKNEGVLRPRYEQMLEALESVQRSRP